MFSPTKDTAAVEEEVQAVYRAMFPNCDPESISNAFDWMADCFSGDYAGYQPIDARYHDLEHTMQGTLCMARLLHGRHKAGAQPAVTQRLFDLGFIAILMHDTGYLKERGDNEGTGAKYTVIHVGRSADLAAQLLTEKSFAQEDIQAVQNMIHCTGLDAALSAIPFQGEIEKIVGHALGTADLLGQMAADDYVDKLPVLYSEFAEGAHHTDNKNHFIATFSSADDLIRRTPAFWENCVRPKIDRDFGALYRFLNDPFPHGPNQYVDRIESNMKRLKQRLGLVETV